MENMGHRFSDLVRRAIYIIETPIKSLAREAQISPGTIYAAMHGTLKMREHTARAIAVAICNELRGQVARREREIDDLKRLERDVRNAYDREYGGNADGG